ncbi:MAG: NAD-binding protein [Dermatophilaceae bacterium]
MADTERRSSRSTLVAAFGTAIVFMLGTWGFALVDAGTWLDHAYRSLQLFVLEAGDGFPVPSPWQLEVARLAAPAMTVISTALAAAALSRGRVDAWRARRMEGHVVIAGLGRRETEAALVLRATGRDVVVVSPHEGVGGVRRCRRSGIPVVIGDPRDPLLLESAGVGRASHLIVLDPNLDASGQVAVAAVGLTAERSGAPLVVHVEMDDPALVGLLRALKLSEHHAPGWRVEELDLAGAGAAIMVDAVAPWPADVSGAEVVVIGDSALATAVVAELRRRWRAAGGTRDGLGIVTSPSWPPPALGRSPDTVFVCSDDESTALMTSLAVLRDLPGTPVVVRIEHAAHFGALLQQDAPDLHVISLDRLVLTPEVLLDTTVERIARALHESYRRHADPADPSAAPWADLPESLRASNRSQAEHVCEKIRATHRILVPDDGEPTHGFTEDEVQQLGRLEHDRWAAERRAAGWRPGPRDATARTSPYLVPWEELSEDVREIDRQFVRALPDILLDAGLRLHRTDTGRTGTARVEAPRSGS